MTFVKNEIQNLKSAKVNDINNTKIEIQKKINNYESTNRLFQQNFNDMKEELLNQLDEINNIKKEDIIKIQEETFGQINQIKNEMNQFNLNIIKENQKFIDYNQN